MYCKKRHPRKHGEQSEDTRNEKYSKAFCALMGIILVLCTIYGGMML